MVMEQCSNAKHGYYNMYLPKAVTVMNPIKTRTIRQNVDYHILFSYLCSVTVSYQDKYMKSVMEIFILKGKIPLMKLF